MPCQYDISSDDFLISVYFEGDVTLRDVLGLIDRVDADPSFVDGMHEFNDMSRLDRLRLKSNEILGIADLTKSLYRRRNLPMRSAFWAPNRFFMSASLYCTAFSRVRGARIATFRDRASALKFLGLPEQVSQPPYLS